MLDQLTIGNTDSYDDFEASVKERVIHAPKKKSIKETVPFSNKTYDFSAINGEIYWEERKLEYVFEIMADSPEELEEKKQGFVEWIMNTAQAELHDPFILDYHFIATFDDIEIDDSEIEKSTITVIFTAYPYMIANNKSVFQYSISEDATTINIANQSSHRITPTFVSEVPFTLRQGNASYAIQAGETTDDSLMFAPGFNSVTVQSTNGSGVLKIEFYNEVF